MKFSPYVFNPLSIDDNFARQRAAFLDDEWDRLSVWFKEKPARMLMQINIRNNVAAIKRRMRCLELLSPSL